MQTSLVCDCQPEHNITLNLTNIAPRNVDFSGISVHYNNVSCSLSVSVVYVYVVTNVVPTMWLLIDGMQAFSKDGLVVLFYGGLQYGSYEFSEIFMCIIELELNSLVEVI